MTEWPKKIRVLPEDVWVVLYDYLIRHEEDICADIDDFGELLPVLQYMDPVMEEGESNGN